MVPDEVIWTVSWLHYLNYEAIPRSLSTCYKFVPGMSSVRPSHPTDGVTAFHVSFLSLDHYQNDSRLTVFLTKGKRSFHVSIFSLVCSGSGYVSVRLSYGQAYTYRPRHTYYVTFLVFVRLYIRTTLEYPCRTVRLCVIATVWIGLTVIVWICVITALAHLCTIF